jgi:hypothetical protein
MRRVGAILGIAAGVLAGLMALIGFVAARRDRRHDLGSVSRS